MITDGLRLATLRTPNSSAARTLSSALGNGGPRPRLLRLGAAAAVGGGGGAP